MPEQAAGIGNSAAHQQCRRPDRPCSNDKVLCLDTNIGQPRTYPVRAHRTSLEADNALLRRKNQSLGTQTRDQQRTARQRSRDSGDEHRLLGAGRTAHAAIADIPAATDIARNDMGRYADFFGPLGKKIVVLVRLEWPGTNTEPMFHRGEPRGHRIRRQLLEPQHFLPIAEGRCRRAEAAGPVDGGRTSDAAPLQNIDGLVGSLARGRFLIQLRIGFGFAHAEIAGGLQGALLNEDDLEPGIGQQFGGNAATGATADDQNIGFQRQVTLQRRSVDVFPPCRQAFTHDIAHQNISGRPG